MAAIGAATLVLWAAEVAGFALGRLPVAGSAYLALATTFGEWFGVGNSKLCEVADPARFGRGTGPVCSTPCARPAAASWSPSADRSRPAGSVSPPTPESSLSFVIFSSPQCEAVESRRAAHPEFRRPLLGRAFGPG
jgi:hypothetical protein